MFFEIYFLVFLNLIALNNSREDTGKHPLSKTTSAYDETRLFTMSIVKYPEF